MVLTTGAIQEKEILNGVLEHFGMDPALVTCGRCDSNWYLEVHQKIMALVPDAYAKVYPSMDAPTADEWAVLTSSEVAVTGSADPEAERRALALVQNPAGYGWVSKAFTANFNALLAHPLTHTAGFAVPNQAAIETVAARLQPTPRLGLRQRALLTPGQCRVTPSPRQERLRAGRGPWQEGKRGLKTRPKAWCLLAGPEPAD